MSFENTIFNKYFSKYDKRVDINKNYQDKGTLERFIESLGKSIDDELISSIESAHGAMTNPDTALDRYVEYLEHSAGYNLDHKTLYINMNPIPRRNILRHISRYYQIKGTVRCYELMFKMMGFTTVTITQRFNRYGFDSDTTFDDTVRTFDLKCSPCSGYSVALTGSLTPNQAMYDAVRSILQFNEPINCRLEALTYNTISILDRAGYVDDDYVEDAYVASS